MEKIIIDEAHFFRTISRVSHEIIEKHASLNDIILVGIKRRGAEVAKLIQKKIKELSKITLPYMALDISLYRDDREGNAHNNPVYKGASEPINIQDKIVILVDDVLFTGRTVRAALDALIDFGRASKIELVIFIDRGHRELPIRADYVGKNIPTARKESIQVRTQGIDGCYEVALISPRKG